MRHADTLLHQQPQLKIRHHSRRKLLDRLIVTPAPHTRSEDPLARRSRSLEFSSVVTKEGKLYVADCPELEIASQGRTVELALRNLREAIELYLQDEDARVPEVDYRPMVTVVKVVRA
jgi:predicted RNase H-like HicB family nuclease